jgi:pimeloyl-ACP methyl ester carboxylesterase
MSAITLENDLVHYEVLGRGRPVIFVHGWLGSWRYWVPTMQQLSMKYRTYALDLWGFGDSGKEASKYGFAEQVKLLHDFMEKLGIAKAALVGHSLGAAIALRYAGQYPDRAPRVALISPPLFDLGGLDEKPIVARTPASAAVTPVAAPAATSGSAQSTTPAATPSNAVSATAPAATAVGTATPASAPSVAPTSPASDASAGGNTAAGGSPNPAAPSTGASSATSDTLPRNPLRGMGDTPEEILAHLQAKNTVSAAGVAGAAPTTANPLPPGAPALPTNIATPILKTAPASVAPTAPAPTSTRAEVPNPLLAILTGIKPAALLVKHVDRDAADLDKLRAEVEKTDEAAIIRSAQSFTGVNLSVELQRLTSPTLILHGKDDPLLPAPSDDLIDRIARNKPVGNLLAFVEPDLRHFPMLEITAKFNRLLMDFLDAQDLTNVQFKDQWRRTMR